MGSRNTLFKIEFYVPESHLSAVKLAMFEAGAGKLGDYDQCAWQTKGRGQYRPLAGSDPYQGDEMKLEELQEFKVELVCPRINVKSAVRAMIAAHPYEEVAYSIVALHQLGSFE